MACSSGPNDPSRALRRAAHHVARESVARPLAQHTTTTTMGADPALTGKGHQKVMAHGFLRDGYVTLMVYGHKR